MFQTIINMYDVFETDIYMDYNENENKDFFSTNPMDYLRANGFYC